MRRAAREVAFKFIFEYLFLKEKRDLTDFTVKEEDSLDESDILYIKDIYGGVVGQFDALSAKISTYAEGYKLERIYRVDLAILLLAAYEILHADVPGGVAANEAVELARIYSTKNSGAFINGILSSIIKEAK